MKVAVHAPVYMNVWISFSGPVPSDKSERRACSGMLVRVCSPF